MDNLNGLIEKIIPSGKQLTSGIISTLLIILYIHTEIKSNFEESIRIFSDKMDGIHKKLDVHIATTKISQDKLEKDIARYEVNTTKLEDRVMRIETNVFWLDRFYAENKTAIPYINKELDLIKKKNGE